MRGLLVIAATCSVWYVTPVKWNEAAAAAERARVVLRVQIEDQAITPVTARYIKRAIQQAQETRPECLLIELDTPGGLLQSTQEIVTAILGSRVPVVVYVSPSGGRAASAGLFITLSSHVAAMAPGTRLGAAHPVQIGGLPLPPTAPPQDGDAAKKASPQQSPMEDKLVNDTQAWARGLAQLRGRNAEWAALAVTESRVLLCSEAVAQGVVELEARDLPDLLEKLDGRQVTLGPSSVLLRTSGAQVRTLDMWWGERLLAVVSNPNVVIFLLMFGMYGVLFELYSPGWGVAGTLGVVSLVLGFFGFLQTLVEVGSENNTTIVFPVPLELASTFLTRTAAGNGAPRPDAPQSRPAGEPLSGRMA